MPAWFSKVFNRDGGATETAQPAPPPLAETDFATEEDDDEESAERPRRVVHAPLIAAEEEVSAYSENVAIKARIEDGSDTCTFMVDRPLLPGFSFFCKDKDTAYACAPLAAALFDACTKVGHVLIMGTNVTVAGPARDEAEWEQFARDAGAVIREHLKSGKAVVLPEVIAQIPGEEEIRRELQEVIDREINPGIASHSGVITLNRVLGNTAYITMGGGCQGCAASSVTLRQGVDKSFRDAVPLLGALLDETDHSAGENPYFRDMPTGFEG
jgi:Fe-S cluster biogenesis protein NfuA